MDLDPEDEELQIMKGHHKTMAEAILKAVNSSGQKVVQGMVFPLFEYQVAGTYWLLEREAMVDEQTGIRGGLLCHIHIGHTPASIIAPDETNAEHERVVSNCGP